MFNINPDFILDIMVFLNIFLIYLLYKTNKIKIIFPIISILFLLNLHFTYEFGVYIDENNLSGNLYSSIINLFLFVFTLFYIYFILFIKNKKGK